MIETTWAKVAALRLRRQHLETRAPRKAMLDVVRDHVAVQAQVIGSAELAIHARVERMTRDDVRNALWRDRTLVKTWAMRGTLHLVASDELPELVAALGTRINWLRPVWLRYFEVTREEMLALQDGIGDVLTDTPMTRAALGEALAKHLGNEAFADRVTSSWGTFLKPAASRGLLCFGPDDGRNVTFVDPRAWLGREMPEPSEDAIGAVIERQLTAFPGSSQWRARTMVGRPGRRAAAQADRVAGRPRGRDPGRRHEGAGPERRRRRARQHRPVDRRPAPAGLRPLHAVPPEGGRAAAPDGPPAARVAGPPAGSARW